MTTARELNKKSIFVISDGRRLGDIKDLYIDATGQWIVAIFLGKEGVFSRRSLVLPVQSIQVPGVDCWLAAPAAEVVELSALEGHEHFMLVSDLRGREVATERQTRIGTVGDLVIGPRGEVAAIALGKVHVQGPLAQHGSIPRSAVISFGDKKSPVVINMAAAEAAAAGPAGQV